MKAIASSLMFGIFFGAAGLIVATIAWSMVDSVGRPFDWAQWAAMQPADGAKQLIPAIVTGGLAVFLLLVSFSNLRRARALLRPAGESSDGNARIALNAEHPRVGRPLEGSLLLRKDPEPGDMFRLELSCTRWRRSGVDTMRMETAYSAQQDVQVKRGVQGWSLPFRFEIPMTAPPSAPSDRPEDGPFVWRLAFFRTNALIKSGPTVTLELGPPTAGEYRAAEAAESPAQREAIDAIGRQLKRPLLPQERARLRTLSLMELERIRMLSGTPMKILLWLKWGMVVLVLVPLIVWSLILVFRAI